MSIKPCTDHNGSPYPSITEMCRQYGITKDLYKRRIQLGWNIEKALTTPTAISKIQVADHEGNVFPSKQAMCNHYGINTGTFNNRIRNGMSIKEALLTQIGTNMVINGKSFKNAKEACAHFGIEYSWFLDRQKNGEKPGDIIKAYHEMKNRATDHLGNTYPSTSQMCKAYGISPKTYRGRINRGWTLEKALTKQERHMERRSVENVIENIYINTSGIQYRIIGEKITDCTIEFSDKKTIESYTHSKKHSPVHPQFQVENVGKNPRKGKDQFAGFTIIRYSFSHNKDMYFECTCNECGYEGILNPQEMILHRKTKH